MSKRAAIKRAWQESEPSGAIERAISAVSPRWAHDRRMARFKTAMMATSYKAGDRSRKNLKATQPGNGSANSDELPELSRLRELSRDAVRNSPLARAGLRTIKTKVVGCGIVPQSRVDVDYLRSVGVDITDEQAQALERRMEFRWRAWAADPLKRCDAGRKLRFDRLAAQALGSAWVNGDAFAMWIRRPRADWPFPLQVQLIEADRVSNPNWRADGSPAPRGGNRSVWGGVEQTPDGMPVAYWVQEEHPGETLGAGHRRYQWRRIAALNRFGEPIVSHVVDPERIGSSRGVPALASVLEVLKLLTDYSESEATAALVSSFFTVFVKSQGATGLDDLLGVDAPSEPTDLGELEMGSGLINDLAPGEDVTFANPNRPSTAYGPFIDAQLRFIGAGLGIPLEVLTKHFQSSYSAARGSLIEAWETFFDMRDMTVDWLYVPAWRALHSDAAAAGEIEVDERFFTDELIKAAYLGAQWTGQPPGQLDETKAVRAAVERIEARLSTRQIEAAKLGNSVEEIDRQLAKEGAPGGMTEPVNAPDAEELDAADEAEAVEAEENTPKGDA